MSIRVSPTEPNPTHHVALRGRDGRQLGLILCDEQGQPKKDAGSFLKSPVETTALKQTSGGSSYDIFDYPYSPIVQDDLSGGRGNNDLERDSTKYYDSFRTKSGRANKAYAGPQEQYTAGEHRSFDQSMPGSVKWHTLAGDARHIYHRFQPTATYTIGMMWLSTRIKGTPGNLTIALYSDSAGSIGAELDSVVVPYTRMDDILSEWLCETVSTSVTAATYYWVVIYAEATDDESNHWKIGVKNEASSTYYSGAFDSTPTAADFDLYFRTTPANVEQTCIPFEYKEARYFVINEASGAPRLFIAGDRGTADSNSGALSRLNDATKSWTVDEWVGFPVLIIKGLGRNEKKYWRTITANGTNYLVVDEDWTITHNTTTEYVILGTKPTEITGHGLTDPVTDVFVSTKNVIYFCQGDGVNIRRARYLTSAGVWSADYANDGTNKAVFMTYMPLGTKIVAANNNDANGNVSIKLEGAVPVWGTDITFGTEINVDSEHRRINGLIVYPDVQGTEAVYILKEDGVWTHDGGTGEAEQVSLKEFQAVRSQYAGVNPLHHNVYLYFPLQYGLERYYSGTFDDIGPNLGEGLPANRRGPIVAMEGYPGKFFAAIDAGDAGYSSILDSDGWHERYRAPLGQRILALAFQAVPGASLDRLWMFQGNDLVWLPFPSETVNELEDANYPYTPEFSVTLARMHAGIFDVQKVVKLIKLQSENLEVESGSIEPVCWFELDYRLNDEEDWTTFDDKFTTSPNQEIDLTEQYGLAGKRMQFRLRGYTTDNSKTPIFLAIIVNAVLRTDVKYMYPMTFRLMDREPLLSLEEIDEMSAQERLKLVENWADASSDTMLKMESVSPLFHGKMIFLNPPTTRQVRFKSDTHNEFKKDVFVCSVTVQEA
jgi:hypothetical protein